MRLIFTRNTKHRLVRIIDAVCLFLGMCFLAALAFAALSMEVHAAPSWFTFEIPYKYTPPAASACGGRWSACQNNAASNSWTCYCVK